MQWQQCAELGAAEAADRRILASTSAGTLDPRSTQHPARPCRAWRQVQIAARSVVRHLDAARRTAGDDPGRLRHVRAPPDQGAHRCRQEARQGPRRAVRATAKTGSAPASGSVAASRQWRNTGRRSAGPTPSIRRRSAVCSIMAYDRTRHAS